MRVYYSKDMVANTQSYSPSSSKPAEVVKDWRAAGLDIEVKKPIPVSGKTIAQAHDPDYVQGVLSCTVPNGFGNCDESVAKSLPFTVGAMVSATKYALKTGENAAALCSGFHHATWGGGGGFCTFEGTIIASIEAHKVGAHRVGIFDVDQHWGNGAANIIDKLKINWIEHYSAGKFFGHNPDDAEPFLEALPTLLRKRFYDCHVVIVQCGADPYINDPLGGWMTIEQLARRDKIIFETFKQLRIGVAFNLAGGYARDANGGISPVLEIHRNTAIACIEAFSKKTKGAA